MNQLKISILSVFVVFSFSAHAQKKVTSKDLDKVFQWMSGRFSSETQSKSDTDFFSISLQMRPVWKQSATEKWLYVEQAMATDLKKPYRQRVYHLTLSGDSAILSTVYEIPGPARFVGGVQNPEMLKVLTKDSLISRQGCAITLKKINDETFAGSTPGKECLSSLRKAKYATSKVQVTATGIESWDQGWDEKDVQVWGAKKGGYIFEKKENW